jgi:uncharacterized protein
MTTGLLPQALLDPAAYPHHPESVELRETHISWVFLAGDRAYKVKKPVTLPFLDYGTLELRRAYCEEELRLDRRFAPDVYLGVVSLVARGPGALAIAPAGEPLAVDTRSRCAATTSTRRSRRGWPRAHWTRHGRRAP